MTLTRSVVKGGCKTWNTVFYLKAY